MRICIQCEQPLKPHGRKYCSNKCQSDYAYHRYIRLWRRNEHTPSLGISHHIIRYLFDKYEHRCALCAWSQRNPTTNKIPLEVDHINGDAFDHREENLLLLCPNCHSLTPTYKNLNKGKGRLSRMKIYGKILRMPL